MPPGAALATAGAFRPGGQSWVLAERALGFLKALGGLGPDGLQYVAATMPALHSAMLASLDHSRPLRWAFFPKLLTVTVQDCKDGMAICDGSKMLFNCSK